MVASGSLRIELPGVYAVVGAPRGREQRLMAALLWAGEGASISHRSAAELWGFDGFRAPRAAELTSPRRLRHAKAICHRSRLTTQETTRIGRIRVTDPARTLLDLGAVAAEAEVRVAVDDALRGRLTTGARLKERLSAAGPTGRSGWGVLRGLLEEPVAESVLERRLLRVLRRAGLPRPVTQHAIREGSRLIARADFAYPAAKLAIEAEGWRYHGGPEAFRRDLARRNRITSAGWTVLHAVWLDLDDPRALIAAIRRALGPTARRRTG